MSRKTGKEGVLTLVSLLVVLTGAAAWMALKFLQGGEPGKALTAAGLGILIAAFMFSPRAVLAERTDFQLVGPLSRILLLLGSLALLAGLVID